MTEATNAVPDPTRDVIPPADYWLIDPRKEKKQTPTDSRGLVVVNELIEVVQSCIDPAYEWHLPPDEHHLYWPRSLYAEAQAASGGAVPALTFREMCDAKIWVQRDFHKAVHWFTFPPPMPSPKVMRPYIDGLLAARHLFDAVREVKRSERINRRRLERAVLTEQQRESGMRVMEHRIARQSRGIERHLGQLSTVPPEYWPFNPELPLEQLANKLGEIMVRGRHRRTRAIRLATV